MSSWRTRCSTFLRKWRLARDDVKQAKDARRDEREGEELDRARSGADRFPPMRG